MRTSDQMNVAVLAWRATDLQYKVNSLKLIHICRASKVWAECALRIRYASSNQPSLNIVCKCSVTVIKANWLTHRDCLHVCVVNVHKNAAEMYACTCGIIAEYALSIIKTWLSTWQTRSCNILYFPLNGLAFSTSKVASKPMGTKQMQSLDSPRHRPTLKQP